MVRVLDLRWILVISFVVSRAVSAPVDDLEVVGSMVNEVKVESVGDLVGAGTHEDPDNYEESYDSGDKGKKGYLKKNAEKGKSGYKHFDSFHKNDDGKHHFEHHVAYGSGKKGEKSKKKGDHKAAGTGYEEEYAEPYYDEGASENYEGEEGGEYDENVEEADYDY